MNLVDPAINDYLFQLTPPRHKVFVEMEAYATEHDFPAIGPLVGHFLQQMVIITKAKRIFEMGSGYGYSALWMALGMKGDGVIECTESDVANIERGKKYARELKLSKRLKWHHSDALDAMNKAKGKYDIILNDVHKHQYPEALRLAWPKLRKGGIMVTDNVLADGRVVTENPPQPNTAGVLEFNRLSYALPDAICSIMPLRDGLLLAVKK